MIIKPVQLSVELVDEHKKLTPIWQFWFKAVQTAVNRNFLNSSATPGAVTNNQVRGRVAIAAGASSVVVTNNLVTANSTVLAMISQSAADATLTQVVRVSPTAGSFTITGNAAATGNVVVDFMVFN